jgi:DNA-binding IclR family transcriptional regulator
VIRALARRRDQRRADDDRRVLAALRHSDPAGLYDLWTRTGLRSAGLCRALDRLMDDGLVALSWNGLGPRRYRLARMDEMTLRPQSALPYREEKP